MARWKTGNSSKVNFISKRRFLLLAVLIPAAFCSTGFSQDTNYWTYQYGSRSTLLGGAIVGSVLDISGIYYNPGGLALIDDPEVFLAARSFQYPNYTLKRQGFEDLKLNSSRIGTAPSLYAGMMDFESLNNHRITYAYLTRYESKLNLRTTIVSKYSSDPNSGEENDAIFDYRLDEDLSEPWFGITWSYKVQEKLGIGISTFATFRDHRINYSTLGEVVSPDGNILITLGTRDLKYSNYRLLWKLGFTFDFIGLSFGFTVTTPSIEVYSSGSAGLNLTYIGGDVDNNGITDTLIAATYQDNLDSDYPTPLSIGIGTTHKIDHTRIYLSAEWFSKVNKFEVLNTKDFYSQTSGQLVPFTITHEARAVLNFGVGIEHFFSKNFSYYGSFTTDYSSKDSDSGTNLSVTSWNIYHIMTGANLRIKRVQLTLGFGYSFGNDEFNAVDDIISSDLENIIPRTFESSQFYYNNFRLLFGFSF